MPSTEELAQERVMRNGLVLDTVIVAAFIVVSLWSISLTIIAETLRTVVMLALSASSLLLLWRVNRGRFADLDFGSGKLEQAQTVLIAAGLIGSAGVVAFALQRRLSVPRLSPAAALDAGLLLACVNLVVNIWFYRRMSRVRRGVVSLVFESERRSWLIKAIASAAVVASIAVYAACGGNIGYWSDIVGGCVVACFMVWTAFSMIRRAMPDLLDKALDEELQLRITRVLAAHFDDYDGLGRLRSRRAGNHIFVELDLAFDPARSFASVAQRLQAIRSDLERELPNGRFVLVPVVEGMQEGG